MSFYSCIIKGYGVNSHSLYQVKTEALVEFVKKHLPDAYQKMMDDITQTTNEPSPKDYETWLKAQNNETSRTSGIYAVIANVMWKETGIRFEYHIGENDEVIMLPQCMPWHYNIEETQCTADSLDKLFKKYFEELGVAVAADYYIIESY